MNDEELSALLGRHATRHTAPERLRAAVRTQVALKAAASDDTARRPAAAAPWRWRPQAMGFAAGVALTLVLALGVPRWLTQQELPGEIVAQHVRALRAGPLFEVASSDRHTVKPWFQGKLDYAPQIVDLASAGYPLLGGRVEHIAGAPTAALAYTARQHVISVFVRPLTQVQPPESAQRRGFNLLHWSDGSMQVWLVSDVEAAELDRFGQAWRAQTAAH